MNYDRVDVLLEKLTSTLYELEDEVKSDRPLQVNYEDILKYYEFDGS